MFRTISGVLKVRCLLQQRAHVPKITISSLQRYGSECNKKHAQRELCFQPKEEPPMPPNDSIFWGAMAVLTIAGGFAVYAKHNPEIRDWLTLHAPWFDDIIAVAYQENMSYLEFAMSCFEGAKDRALKNINNFLSPDNECNPVQNIEQIIIDEGDNPCKLSPPSIVTTDICELEACVKDFAESTINNYMTARDACRYYNELVAETLQKFTIPGLKNLRAAMLERRSLVETSLANAKTEHEQYGTLCHYLNCGVVMDNKKKLENTRELLRELDDKIKTVHIEFQLENIKSGALDVQWIKLEAFLDSYINEMNAVYPELNYMDQKPMIVSDPEFFLHHTRRYIQTLQDDLHDTLDAMTSKVDRGLESLPQGEKEVQNRKKEITRLYGLKLKDFENESEPAAKSKIKQDVDKLTKDLLKQMKIDHEAAIIRRTMDEEQRIMKKFDKIVAERVKAKTDQFGKHLRLMSKNLTVVNTRLQRCSRAVNETKRSQDLWAAASSLLRATKKGDPLVNVTEELKALEKASGSDELVMTVLKAIPRSVWVNGVVPESVLRQKYQSMESIAMKVALVDGKGSSLVVYFLSLIQSFFLSMKISAIPQNELDNPPQDLDCKYDTFDLLQRARYFIDRGNIPAAFRYVDALQGASRGAAASWLEAAQAHVKIRQAAETVIAHAVAMGLKYV